MKLLDEIRDIASQPKDLRSFGRTVGIAFALLGGLLWWRHRPAFAVFLALAAFFLFFAFVWPRVLKPIHKVWMTAALLMGWVMTRVILSVLFFLVITPIGLITRAFGVDFMKSAWDKKAETYWTDHPEKEGVAHYEEQY